MGEIIKKQDHRREFIDTLIELAEKDETITLNIPDVGFLYVDEFSKRFPDRFFNNGCTELFTIADAVGQSLEGAKPYCYSMINFVLFRPYEAVRNCVVHHKANVKLLGVKGSSSYKFLGFSHNMTHEYEDIEACKALNLKSYLPTNNEEVKKAVLDSYGDETACYIRL